MQLRLITYEYLLNQWRLITKANCVRHVPYPACASQVSQSCTMREEEACPYRIVGTAGSGFMVAWIAAPYDAWRGARASPEGHELKGALRHVRMRTPARAGAFALWGLVVSSFECISESLRGKQDPWNRIAAMGAVRGTLVARAGPRIAILRTLEGASLWAVVELSGLMMYTSTAKILIKNTPLPRLEGEAHDAPRCHQRTDGEQQHLLTLCGEWATPPATTPIRKNSDDSSTSSTEAQLDQTTNAPPPTPDTPHRLWVGAFAIAAAASAAKRYRYPLTHAARSAITKFNESR